MPPVPAPGVPESVAEPLPWLVSKVTPAGNEPDSESFGAGDPLVLTEKLNALPTVTVVAEFEVNAGTCAAATTSWIVDADDFEK